MSNGIFRYIILFASISITCLDAIAAPGDILFTDDFESGLGNWTVVNGTGDAGIGTHTANSGTRSLYTRWNVTTVTSNVINTNVPGAQVSMWVRKGSDAFSEDPEATNEDLVVEYFNNASTWITLQTFVGSNETPGAIFTPTYSLNSDALHTNFRIRVRQTGGDGNDWDYWHIDDVVVTETAPAPPLSIGDCDDFESGISNWNITGTGGSAGIGTYTANSGTQSLYTRWNTITVTSDAVDASSANSLAITAWIRRGDDNFSEDPDPNEDLVVEYFNNASSWITLETFLGSGTDGQIHIRTYMLGNDALHANFQLRFRQTGGSNVDWDYWHVDDVCFLDPLSSYYAMDESSWASAGDVTDSSGNGNDGNPIGNVSKASANPAIAGDPGTCGYGVFPSNTSTNTFDAVNTTQAPGNAGAITFWYNSNTAWSGGGSGDRMLIDASSDLGNNSADKYFFLVKRSNGRLRFRLEDSGDTDTQAETGALGFTANTWVHIAITWDLPNDTTQIYVNGVLNATSGTNVNGTVGTANSLYIGDNRTSGVSGSGYSGNSANGLIDEVRIYNVAIPQSTIAADMASTQACATTDHFAISHDGSGVTCQTETITITAHDGSHATDTSYTGNLSLGLSSTTGSANHGDWTLITGNGTLNNGTADDGAATYTMVAADMGTVQLGYKNTHIETVNFSVTDGSISEQSGSALASEDQDMVFAESGFQFITNSFTNTIGTQIAGKDSNIVPGNQTIELQAIRTSDSTGACEAALTGNIDIELAFECENPTTCSTNQVSINGTNISGNPNAAVSSYTSVSLDFGNASDTTATLILNYPDVGQLQLHAQYDIPLDDGSSTPSGNLMQGSSNSFVVRPFGFYVDVAGNPAATSAAGAGYIGAGNNFTVSASAVVWQATDDTDNDGIPDNHGNNNPADNADLSDNSIALNYGQETGIESIALSAVLVDPSGGNDPGLTGGNTIGAFINGTGSTVTAQYNEVGIIEISANVADGDYLGIGAAATNSILGDSGYVGRFYPDHFALTNGMITERIDQVCAPASTYSYMGEILRLELTLTAENTSNTTTQNYVGGFAKLDPTVIADWDVGAIDTTGPTPLTARIGLDTASGTWIAGVVDALIRVQLNRAATVDGPYQNLQWGINPVDTPDGVSLNTLNMDEDNDTINDHGLVSTSDSRFGRAIVESAFGSELLSLTVPLNTQYFDGTQFIRNNQDSCTAYDSTDLSFSNRQGLSADPTAAGNGNFIQGTHDTGNLVTLDSNNETGSIDATLDMPSWLHFDWDNDGNFDDDPEGHMTFGIFGGSDRQIYSREIY